MNQQYVMVLILVLMEDTLRVCLLQRLMRVMTCLNPCFNGRYSQRRLMSDPIRLTDVLILVLMEDTLRVTNPPYNTL